MQTDGTKGAWLGLSVLGALVDTVQLPDVMAQMERWIESPERCHYIAVTDMHGVMEAHKHPDFKTIVNSAALSIPDGISLTWIGPRRGFPLKKRACGPDLMWAFCRLASQRRYENFFYSETAETLQLLTARLQEQFPGLDIAGIYSPPSRPLTAEEDGGLLG
jgi:N-acetylglucosaminyldiphosphoundecaprenol N-acetyl-beta-D-mannosaminyltransferase